MRKLLLSVFLLIMPVSVWAWTTTNNFNTLTTSDGWYNWDGGYGGIVSITGNQSAPGSPSNSLQVTVPAGFPDSGVPGGASFVFPSATKEFWMQYYFKYGSNFVFHSSGNKQVYIWGNLTSGGVIDSWLGGKATMHPMLANNWRDPNTSYNPTINRNQWYKVVFHLKLVSAGHDVFQLWVDDGLVSDYSNLSLLNMGSSDYSSAGYTKVAIDPVWGGQGDSPVPATQDQWYDDVIVSTNPIGSITEPVIKIPSIPSSLVIK